jgi:hypothetical protein
MNTREDFYTRRRQFRLSCSQPLRWRKSMRELREALEALLDISPFATNGAEGEIHLRASRAIQNSKEEL